MNRYFTARDDLIIGEPLFLEGKREFPYFYMGPTNEGHLFLFNYRTGVKDMWLENGFVPFMLLMNSEEIDRKFYKLPHPERSNVIVTDLTEYSGNLTRESLGRQFGVEEEGDNWVRVDGNKINKTRVRYPTTITDVGTVSLYPGDIFTTANSIVKERYTKFLFLGGGRAIRIENGTIPEFDETQLESISERSNFRILVPNPYRLSREFQSKSHYERNSLEEYFSVSGIDSANIRNKIEEYPDHLRVYIPKVGETHPSSNDPFIGNCYVGEGYFSRIMDDIPVDLANEDILRSVADLTPNIFLDIIERYNRYLENPRNYGICTLYGDQSVLWDRDISSEEIITYNMVYLGNPTEPYDKITLRNSMVWERRIKDAPKGHIIGYMDKYAGGFLRNLHNYPTLHEKEESVPIGEASNINDLDLGRIQVEDGTLERELRGNLKKFKIIGRKDHLPSVNDLLSYVKVGIKKAKDKITPSKIKKGDKVRCKNPKDHKDLEKNKDYKVHSVDTKSIKNKKLLGIYINDEDYILSNAKHFKKIKQ